MGKLKMHSPHLTEDNIARVREMFSGCVTETKSEDGRVKLAVVFDLLFHVLLDWGVDLTPPIEKKAIEGKDVFFVDGDELAACFDAHGGIDEVFVKELAAHKPRRMVFRDADFKDSAVKINVEQIFKLLSLGTDVKSI